MVSNETSLPTCTIVKGRNKRMGPTEGDKTTYLAMVKGRDERWSL